jgi:ADP-ribose pyrophosphatase YjhB (NUDIX family)
LLRRALRLAASVWAPRQRLGAVGVLLDGEGRVLLAKHALRPHVPWGLPGGWVERGEHPAEGVRRELHEELGLRVETGALLRVDRHGVASGDVSASGLTLTYACALAEGVDRADACVCSWELLAAAWVPVAEAPSWVRSFEAEAIAEAARQAAAQGSTAQHSSAS